MTEQPKEWLPKEFSSYADLMRACYEDAHQALTKNLGEDESKWKWGEMVKVRFQHPLSGAPLIGSGGHGQCWCSGLDASDRGSEQLGQHATRNSSG